MNTSNPWTAKRPTPERLMGRHAPQSSRRIRLRPLALGVVLALSGPVQAQSAPPGLRANTEARIFAQWARPGESSGHTHASAAQTRVVSNCDDAGAGSLRDTLAGAGVGDTIDLSGLTCGTIQLQSGALVVDADDIHLLGPGADKLVIDGGATDRVLIDPHSLLTLTGLSIRNGADRSTGFNIAGGGCIAAAGELTLVDSVVSGCLAAGEGAYGGALYAFALTMRNSTISGSSAYGYLPGTGTAANGGAAFVYQVDLVASTISGNRASHYADPPRSSYDVGGGIMTVRGGRISASVFDNNQAGDRGGAINSLNDLAIANSTLADNSVTRGRGGAIYMRRPARLALSNVTINGNRAAEGGGLHLTDGGANVVSSIVAGNYAATVAGSNNISATVPLLLSGEHNLIAAGHPGITLPADTISLDPKLLPLADNGGPTRSMALLPASPALDAGSNPMAMAFDQRGPGYPRVLGSAADIGAFEGSLAPFVSVPALSARMAAWLALLLAGFAAFSLRAARGSLSGTMDKS